MSKIAQQKALEAYPEIRLYEPNYDENVESREGYIKGYDQALQDFLEKSCDYLQKNIWRINIEEYEFLQRFVTDFKKYMQNEM